RLADQAMGDYEMREGEIYQLVIEQIEHALIDRALAKGGGVKTKASDFLGINQNTLNKKVKELGIEAADGRRYNLSCRPRLHADGWSASGKRGSACRVTTAKSLTLPDA